MKRPETAPNERGSKPSSEADEAAAPKIAADGSIHRDMHFVHKDGPSVRVREYAVEDERGVRFSAELTAVDGGVERAIIDASTHAELQILLETAAYAFSLAVRLRVKAPAKGPVP